jgi:hypothetical protein
MQLNLRIMSSGACTSRFQSAMRWFIIIALLIQLIALTQHHHDLASHPDDCEACYIIALSSGGGTPPIYSAILALPFIQVSGIAVHPDYVIHASSRNFIRPLPQAPPQV